MNSIFIAGTLDTAYSIFFVGLTSFLISLHAPLISKWLSLVTIHWESYLCALCFVCQYEVIRSILSVSLVPTLSFVQSLETRLHFCTSSPGAGFDSVSVFYMTHVQVFVHQANIMLF